MKTFTNSSSVLKVTVAAFILTLLAFMTISGALAHGVHGATKDKCTLRAQVSASEANDLTGKTIGVHASGAGLDLSTEATAGDHTIICTYGFIKFVTNILLVTILVVATLLIVYAAFLFVTAGESPEKRDKARSFLIFAIIGLVVASVAAFIPTIVRGIIL